MKNTKKVLAYVFLAGMFLLSSFLLGNGLVALEILPAIPPTFPAMVCKTQYIVTLIAGTLGGIMVAIFLRAAALHLYARRMHQSAV